MNRTQIMIAAACAVCLAAGCRRTDYRDFTVEIPALTAANTNAVYQSIAGMEGNPPAPVFKGVDRGSVVFDLARHQLRLRYDSMQLAHKNIEMAIAEAGFAANGVTPASIGAKDAPPPATK